MVENITKFINTTTTDYTFSVLIPTWNNLAYLQLCIKSILKNSQLKIQIIIIVNEGMDGTLAWMEQQKDIDYVFSKSNIGICYGLNSARALIKSEYLVYVNDDMYLLPGWDAELFKEIQQIGSKEFMLSCTMIEPVDTGNACVIVKDFGRDLNSFNEKLLLKEYSGLTINDWSGSMWPPNIVHIDVWDLVGGLSVEYSPGMYSDPDFSMKLFQLGVRYFKGKGNSLVYHFGSKSTARIKRNKGRKTFLLKWGITSKYFTKKYLKSGQSFTGPVSEPKLNSFSLLLNKIKRMISCW